MALPILNPDDEVTGRFEPIRRGRSARPAPRVSGVRDALVLALHHAPALGGVGEDIASAIRNLLERIDRVRKDEAA